MKKRLLMLMFCSLNANSTSVYDGAKRFWDFKGAIPDSIIGATGIPTSDMTYTADRFGNPESAWLLDGIDDSLLMNESNGLNLSEYSYSFWFKTESLAQEELIFVTYGDFDVVNDNAVFYISNGENLSGWTNRLYADSNWHNIVVTNSAQSRTGQLFYDGELVSSGGFYYETSFNQNLVIGYDPYSDFSSLLEYFDGSFDDFAIWDKVLTPTEVTELYNQETSYGGSTVYSIGDNPSEWLLIDNDPVGGTITQIYDDAKQDDVIELSGAGLSNSYMLTEEGTTWNNTSQFFLQWSMNYSEDYEIYVQVDTTNGVRYLRYNNSDTDQLLHWGIYIHHGLGQSSSDGTWHTYARNLQADISAAEPGNTLLAVQAMTFKGSGRIDDVFLKSSLPTFVDSDNDGLTNIEEQSYGTDPYVADSDGDGLNDGEEAAYYGNNATDDYDDDGLSNILDEDADNDGFLDGQEIISGTDPINENDTLATIYSLGEHNNNWLISDNVPAGASINVIYDDLKQDNVIEFTGSGQDNAYMVLNENNTYWNNNAQFTLQWSMRFNEEYGIYVQVDTLFGVRYLRYTNLSYDLLLHWSIYIHHGLGVSSSDNTWHSYSRNLQNDLSEAEPGNMIIAVQAMSFRGNGRVDDVKLNN